MIYAQPNICIGELDAQTPLGFWNTNGLSNLGQTIRLNSCQQKKSTCQKFGKRVENQRKNGGPLDYRIFKMSKRSERCTGDMR